MGKVNNQQNFQVGTSSPKGPDVFGTLDHTQSRNMEYQWKTSNTSFENKTSNPNMFQTSLKIFKPTLNIPVHDFDPNLSDSEFLKMSVEKLQSSGIPDLNAVTKEGFHPQGVQKFFKINKMCNPFIKCSEDNAC